MLGDWVSPNRITVHGLLVFQNKVVTYGYDLTIVPDQGGGKALIADNYRPP